MMSLTAQIEFRGERNNPLKGKNLTIWNKREEINQSKQATWYPITEADFSPERKEPVFLLERAACRTEIINTQIEPKLFHARK